MLCSLALAAFSAHAASVFTVPEPWVRVGIDSRSAEVYMLLRSSQGEAIVGVRSEDGTEITMLASGKARSPTDDHFGRHKH
jgi:hypothetical protein